MTELNTKNETHFFYYSSQVPVAHKVTVSPPPCQTAGGNAPSPANYRKWQTSTARRTFLFFPISNVIRELAPGTPLCLATSLKGPSIPGSLDPSPQHSELGCKAMICRTQLTKVFSRSSEYQSQLCKVFALTFSYGLIESQQ